MPIRMRLRAPSAMHTISVPDDAAVSDLLTTISETTSLPLFELKWGFPPQPLDPSLYGLSTLLRDTDLKLNGAQVIVIAQDTGDQSQTSQQTQSSSQSSSQQQQSAPLSLARKQNPELKDTPEIRVPSRGGTLVLRVMPDDNSCMFRALGTAVLSSSLDSMTELRSLVAQAIQANPEKFDEVTLGRPQDEYCTWIQYSDSWGGGIELAALCEEFDIEIDSVNVQDLSVQRFGENKKKRCILVYSGIHFDTIAFVPDGVSTLDTENDQKIFDVNDDVILESARELCRELQKKNYYTDTKRFDLKCNDCGWKGKGESGAQEHAAATGHINFGQA